MTIIQIDYINYEHSGRPNADYHGNGGEADFTGLVRIMDGCDGRWPAILGFGEADYWEFKGFRDAYRATNALRNAGGPPYVPLLCELPRNGGPFSPAVLYDPNQIQVHHWYYHRLPDFAERNRNLMIASLPGREDRFRVKLIHGDIHDSDVQLADAKANDRLASPEAGCLIMGDWNATPNGPWEAYDYNVETRHRHDRRAHKTRWKHGPEQAGPFEGDTRSLDFLVGYWIEGHRIGGVGFYDVAELEGDLTPTQLPSPTGRQPRTIDRFVINKPWKDRYVAGSYTVYEPADPEHPDSDHKRISFAVDI